MRRVVLSSRLESNRRAQVEQPPSSLNLTRLESPLESLAWRANAPGKKQAPTLPRRRFQLASERANWRESERKFANDEVLVLSALEGKAAHANFSSCCCCCRRQCGCRWLDCAHKLALLCLSAKFGGQRWIGTKTPVSLEPLLLLLLQSPSPVATFSLGKGKFSLLLHSGLPNASPSPNRPAALVLS